MKTRTLLALTLTALGALPLAAADTWTVDKSHSDVSFQVRHFVSKTRGRFKDFSGTIQVDAARPEASSVEFTVQVASIDTSDEKRDAHLRSADFFDAEKNPTLTFKSTSIKPAGKDRYDVTGTLTMHGVAKTVTLPVTYLGATKDPWGNERGGFEIVTKLNRKEYGINWNKTLDTGGLMLGDDVDVSITLETVKKKEPAVAAK